MSLSTYTFIPCPGNAAVDELKPLYDRLSEAVENAVGALDAERQAPKNSLEGLLSGIRVQASVHPLKASLSEMLPCLRKFEQRASAAGIGDYWESLMLNVNLIVSVRLVLRAWVLCAEFGKLNTERVPMEQLEQDRDCAAAALEALPTPPNSTSFHNDFELAFLWRCLAEVRKHGGDCSVSVGDCGTISVEQAGKRLQEHGWAARKLTRNALPVEPPSSLVRMLTEV